VYSDGAGMVICWPSQQWLIQCVYACAIRAIHGEAPTNISFHLISFLIFFFFLGYVHDEIAKWRGGGWTRAKSYTRHQYTQVRCCDCRRRVSLYSRLLPG
jgi:hypothetical protein